MKPHSLIGVFIVVASLLLPTAGHAWDLEWELLDYEEWEGKSEDPGCDADKGVDPFCWATAYAIITYPNEEICAGAYAYVDGRYYIVDYDGENLTAYVSCSCEAIASATYMVEESDYFIQAVADGYAGSYDAYAYVEASEPDEGDVDTDAFYCEEIDMSYPGASVYLGEFVLARADAWYTESTVGTYASAECDVDCDVEEE